jgi:hypothetical protein
MVLNSVAEALPHMEEISDREFRLPGNGLEKRRPFSEERLVTRVISRIAISACLLDDESPVSQPLANHAHSLGTYSPASPESAVMISSSKHLNRRSKGWP